MPLLILKKVDRQILHLNDSAYAIYVESADKKGGDPWVRWARTFSRCLPLTLWQHFGESLSYSTWARDGRVATAELVAISNILNQGRSVLFPGDEYTVGISKLENTSPKLHENISKTIQGLLQI